MEIKKPTYEELEIEVNKLRKLQESNIHSDDALNLHHTSMNSINNAIHTAANINEMMSNVLQAILDLFSVERAWLLFPCDPNATSWAVPMERTKPGYEGAHALGKEIPMLPQDIEFFKRIQQSHDVVCNDYIQNQEEISDRFSVLSDMHMSLHPKTGKTWVFGVHQCTYARVWTEDEKKLFKEIGNKVSDVLNSFLFLDGLKASESKFKTMSEISPLAIYMTSGIEQKAEYINPTFVKLFGYTLEEVPTVDKWWPLAYPNEEYRNKLVAEWQTKVEHAINTKSEIEPMETVVTCKDGSVKNIIWGYISTDIQNWAFGLDITEQKQAEESLRTSKDALDNLTNSLTDIVFSVKMPQRVIEWCNNGIRAIEYEPDEIIGQTTAFLFSDEENYLAFGNRLHQSLEEGNTIFETEQLFKKKNGEIFSANVRVTCDKENGEIVRATSIIRDITEQKQVNYRLQESEEKYRALFNNAPLSYQSLDEDGRFMDVNPSWLRTLGYDRNEVIGKFYADFLHPDWKPHFEKNFPAFKKRGYVNGVEFKIRHKKGHFIDIGFEGCIGYLPDGSFKQTYCVFQDITEKKKVEIEIIKAKEEAEHNELQFKQLVENMADAVFIADTETGFILNVNRAAERLMLMPKNEIIGLHQSKLHPQYSEEYSKKTFRDDSQTKTKLRDTVFVENKILRKDGVEVPIEILSSKVKYEGKECLIGTFRDVSERKKAELQLKASEENLKNTFDLSPSIIAKANMNKGRFIQVNKAITKILGYSIDEFTSRPYMEFVHPDDIQSTIDIATEQLKGNEVTFFENRYLCKDGSYKWMAWHGTKPDEDGVVTTIGSDINERKQAEEELLFQSNLLKAVEQCIIVTKPDGEIIYWNPFAEKTFGWTAEEAIGQNIMSVTVPQLSVEQGTDIMETLNAGKSWSGEFKVQHRNGTVFPSFVSDTPVYNDKGEMIAIIGVSTDITVRKKAEKELIESEERLNEAQRMASIGHWIQDIPSGKLKWSDETFQIFEVDKEFPGELIDVFITTIHPEDREAVTNAFTNALEGKKPYEITHRLQMPDGRVKYVHERSETAYDESGNPVKSIGTVQDVTKLKRAEKQLIKAKEKAEESERKLIEAQKLAHVGSWEYIIDTDTVTWSKEIFNIFKRSHDLPAPSYSEQRLFYTKESFDLLDKAVQDCVQREIPYEIELDIIVSDGSIKQIISKGNVIKDKNNKIIGSYGTAQDITQKKKIEREIIAAKEKAEESDRLKSAFLANMSHEIRTPMNGILGFSNLLKEPKLTGEKQQKYIDIIEKSGERMLNIINDIIDISKIEAGLMKLDITESDINEQLEYIYTFFKPEVEAKEMKLFLRNTLPSNEAIIKTDREKVFAVLTNLVKNAIKYSNKGLIEIGYNKKDDSLEFFVKDTGIGIPKDKQENIFERFIQADIEDKMARQGAGLGLTITKAYIEMLGGKIWVESEEAIGSTFYFTLPYNLELKRKNSTKDIEDSDSSENHIKAIKTLIVEDDETSEMLLSINISEFSDEIITSRTGIEAIEACRNNPDIDLIMMDIQLPELSGYEATRQIRKFNKNVVIIAQTAYGLSDDKEKAIKAGCNDYISKPIKQAELFVLIQKYFKK